MSDLSDTRRAVRIPRLATSQTCAASSWRRNPATPMASRDATGKPWVCGGRSHNLISHMGVGGGIVVDVPGPQVGTLGFRCGYWDLGT